MICKVADLESQFEKVEEEIADSNIDQDAAVAEKQKQRESLKKAMEEEQKELQKLQEEQAARGCARKTGQVTPISM